MSGSYAKELHQRALEWAAAHDEFTQARLREQRATAEREQAAAKFNRINEEMAKCVGSNITQRLFDLGDRRMVLVQHRCDSRADVSLVPVQPSE